MSIDAGSTKLEINPLPRRPLGRTGLMVSPIAYGTFKLGRNTRIKYATPYPLPSEAEARAMVHLALDLGLNLFDTAPAYGLAEARLGPALRGRRKDVVLCTKAGETHEDGQSSYAFDAASITASVERSLGRLKTDVIDVVLIHSDGRDEAIQQETGAVQALQNLKQQGKARFIGLSGKTANGFKLSLAWADVAMVEYSPANPAMRDTIETMHQAGLGVLIKKAMGSGGVDPGEAIRFGLTPRGVSSLVLATLHEAHLRANVAHTIAALRG